MLRYALNWGKITEGLFIKPRFGGYPPAKANMIRAAVRAGIRPGRVAKDFGAAVAMVRKLAAT